MTKGNDSLLNMVAGVLEDFNISPSEAMERLSRCNHQAGAIGQKRMDMTAQERRLTPPWKTQDIPDEEQIVR